MAGAIVSYSVRVYDQCYCCPCCGCTCEPSEDVVWNDLESLNAAEEKAREIRSSAQGEGRWIHIIGVESRGGEHVISMSEW